jgi:hypothetical protein
MLFAFIILFFAPFLIPFNTFTIIFYQNKQRLKSKTGIDSLFFSNKKQLNYNLQL